MKIYSSVSQYPIFWGMGGLRCLYFCISNHQYLSLYWMVEKLEHHSVWFLQKYSYSNIGNLEHFPQSILYGGYILFLFVYLGPQRLLIGSSYVSQTHRSNNNISHVLCWLSFSNSVFFFSRGFLTSAEILNFMLGAKKWF